MIRSRLVLAWYARLMTRRDEDLTLRRFDTLRIDQPASAVPVFTARKAA